MINSRSKGARGERQFAKWLRDTFGLEARRGCQYAGGVDSPDVIGGFVGTHPEVKYVEKMNIDKAMAQAVKDGGGRIPYVAHKRNRGDLMLTIRASDIIEFAKVVVLQDTINTRQDKE